MAKLIKAVVLGLVLTIVIEFGLRYAGQGDFPIYNTDEQIGYVPAPSQSGALLRVNDWALNERSMLSDRPFVSDSRSGVLLIGDSIVWGWLKYPQVDKLGPQLGLRLGRPESVWSVAAGSWAVLNELVWLERNPEVVGGIRDIIWVVNSGDFNSRSLWSSESTHPRKHPVWLTGYLIRKYLAKNGWWPTGSLPATRSGDENPYEALKQFCLKCRRAGGPHIYFVYYPNADELRAVDGANAIVAGKLKNLSEQVGAKFYDLRSNKEWSILYYRDDIHPSLEGNRKLALLLAEFLKAEGDADFE